VSQRKNTVTPSNDLLPHNFGVTTPLIPPPNLVTAHIRCNSHSNLRGKQSHLNMTHLRRGRCWQL